MVLTFHVSHNGLANIAMVEVLALGSKAALDQLPFAFTSPALQQCNAPVSLGATAPSLGGFALALGLGLGTSTSQGTHVYARCNNKGH